MSDPQKRSYINAVLCLTTKKAKSGIPGTINRFDDHHAVHVSQSDSIHFVGHFLLWHRYFVDTYEKALRECGYTGGQPYWDYTLDAEPQNPSSTRIYESEIFQPDTGFGGQTCQQSIQINLINQAVTMAAMVSKSSLPLSRTF